MFRIKSFCDSFNEKNFQQALKRLGDKESHLIQYCKKFKNQHKLKFSKMLAEKSS